MKIRCGLVSNSSSSSFIINVAMYSGLVTTPLLVGWIVYKKLETVKNILKSLKQNCVM